MDNWSDKITVGIAKPEKEPTDVREMRKAIDSAARYSAIVRRAQDTAYYMGLSGEDTHTMLAYYALRELETYFQLNMKFLNTSTPELIIGLANKGP
jgi:hypothetical protein